MRPTKSTAAALQVDTFRDKVIQINRLNVRGIVERPHITDSIRQRLGDNLRRIAKQVRNILVACSQLTSKLDSESCSGFVQNSQNLGHYEIMAA